MRSFNTSKQIPTELLKFKQLQVLITTMLLTNWKTYIYALEYVSKAEIKS